MKSIRTEILIDAPKENVWRILTDFQKYPEWNPFIRSFKGGIEEGGRFAVSIQQPGKKPMTFKPRCLVLRKDEEFRWLGHLFIKGLFDGEHIFRLEETPEGKTNLIHCENFSGILVPLLWKQLDTATRAGFEEMNKALKTRAEAELAEVA